MTNSMPAWTPGGGLHFQLLAQSARARRGRFVTAHGQVETPSFMPVGTQATVKCVLPDQVAATGAQVVLANTYHLGILDRTQIVERLGGLHSMMRWNQTILTDSGGFQVFSLPDREITEAGVSFQFRSGKKDGDTTTPMTLSPESAMDIQRRLGADIVMAFDECVDHRMPPKYMSESLDRTFRWLKRCAAAPIQEHQHLFGIIQGGMELDLRAKAVKQVTSLNLPGYAIGGVSVGEGHDAMVRIVRHTAPLMPSDQVRYLMGVGLPEDLVAAVGCGMDIFDCIIPTRYAREGTVFTWDGKMRLQDKKFRKDRYPIDTSCECPSCAGGFSRAYLRHLLFADEPLYGTLATLHNLHFYQDLMRAIRKAIEENRYAAWSAEFLQRHLPKGAGS
ncbi:MAG TPA: tRNA guanosine(34) transglycosylase Tgt [Planctomycetaceae bacterium]|nr:tRNA guanosine(34) transglycosylase Tgt [Planctomycetaceae bacterium]HQZ63470.1 tRNA guanosine(34) transglycosylase Tgt [Planctomycetaceae bacterium]